MPVLKPTIFHTELDFDFGVINILVRIGSLMLYVYHDTAQSLSVTISALFATS